MANIAKIQGLSPVRLANGAAWTGGGNLYSIAYNYNTALAIGDPVVSSGTSDTNGVPGIQIYSGTGAIRGVILGIGRSEGSLFNPNALQTLYYPANGDGTNSPWYALVADDPSLVFVVNEHANGTALAAAQVGLNTTLQSGSNNGFVSGWQLSSATDATPATTATLPIRLLGLNRTSDNAFGANAKWLVKINVHELGTGTGAAGV